MTDDETDETIRGQATLGGARPATPGDKPTVAAKPQARPSFDEGRAETALAPSSEAPTAPRPSPPALQPTAISDRYKLQRRLGQGGMGEVLLAFDDRIKREVAVKRIRADTPNDEERSRFLREAHVQGRLEHPAVVPVHDLAYDGDGKPFFVMKRLVGTDMHELLKQLRDTSTGSSVSATVGGRAVERSEPRASVVQIDDPIALRRKLLRAFAEVCIAVEFAHVRGIIHRDLKPANIMLGEFGEVYVLDWGVAHATEDAAESVAAPSGRQDLSLATGDTQVGTVLGTPAYMAPEQLVGDKVSAASDIYALGCILYEIAAGEPLHARTRSFGQAFAPGDVKPSTKRPDSPPEIDAICVRALAIDPAERFPTARALGDAVQGFLDGDRDEAVRRELAHHHLEQARDALAQGGDDNRVRAMRAAGRALALDPKGDAAELVTRLMLQPPSKVPDEVERSLETADIDAARAQGRLAALTMAGYLAFIPLLVWAGVRDVFHLGSFAGLAIASGVQVGLLTRASKLTLAPIYFNAALNAALIALIARMVGPFIVAPSLVLTTLVGYASHPRFGRLWVVSGILSLGVIVPWGLELAGVIESTYSFEQGKLVLHSSIIYFESAPTQIAMALLLASLIGVIAVLSRALAMRQHAAARALELQSWQLRQIVPVAPRS